MGNPIVRLSDGINYVKWLRKHNKNANKLRKINTSFDFSFGYYSFIYKFPKLSARQKINR